MLRREVTRDSVRRAAFGVREVGSFCRIGEPEGEHSPRVMREEEDENEDDIRPYGTPGEGAFEPAEPVSICAFSLKRAWKSGKRFTTSL